MKNPIHLKCEMAKKVQTCCGTSLRLPNSKYADEEFCLLPRGEIGGLRGKFYISYETPYF